MVKAKSSECKPSPSNSFGSVNGSFIEFLEPLVGGDLLNKIKMDLNLLLLFCLDTIPIQIGTNPN